MESVEDAFAVRISLHFGIEAAVFVHATVADVHSVVHAFDAAGGNHQFAIQLHDVHFRLDICLFHIFQYFNVQ